MGDTCYWMMVLRAIPVALATYEYERPRMPRRSRIPSNYQTRVRGQRHVFLGGWKLSTVHNKVSPVPVFCSEPGDPTLRSAVPWLSDSSSDNSSSDDDLVLLYSVAQRDHWVHPINKKRRMFGEYHHLMHDLEADDDKFRTYFRLNKEQFDEVLDLIDQGALCACLKGHVTLPWRRVRPSIVLTSAYAATVSNPVKLPDTHPRPRPTPRLSRRVEAQYTIKCRYSPL
ncbi:hypothetical protein J6590_048258 [Homalodisca vitripennis]|nr:hypothetical protein J6590_048258 [Homalodisca vitripennis]